MGWSKNNPKYMLLIVFDTKKEQEAFQEVVEKIQEFYDLKEVK